MFIQAAKNQATLNTIISKNDPSPRNWNQFESVISGNGSTTVSQNHAHISVMKGEETGRPILDSSVPNTNRNNYYSKEHATTSTL